MFREAFKGFPRFAKTQTKRVGCGLAFIFLFMASNNVFGAPDPSRFFYAQGKIVRGSPNESGITEFSRVNVWGGGNSAYRIDSFEQGFRWEFYLNKDIELYLRKLPDQEGLSAYPKTNSAGRKIDKPLLIQEEASIGKDLQLCSIGRLDPTSEFVQLMLTTLNACKLREDQLTFDSVSLNNAVPIVLQRQFGRRYDIISSVAMENGVPIASIKFFSLAQEIELRSHSMPISVENYPGRFLLYKVSWKVPQFGRLPERFRAQAFCPFLDSVTQSHREPDDVMNMGFNEFQLVSEVETNAPPLPPAIDKEIIVRDYRHFATAGNPVAFASRDKEWPTNTAAIILGKSSPDRPHSKSKLVFIRIAMLSVAIVPMAVVVWRKALK